MSYILIVEDDTDNAEILTFYLKLQGLPIRHFSNSKGLIELMESDPPTLAFFDINLPNADGRELCSFIKERLGDSAPPIVIMSAGSDVYETSALEMGADYFMSKPFTPPQITTVLERFLPT